MPTDDFEPIGHDGFGAPLYDHQVDPLPDFRMRWITGIDPAELDEDVKLTIAWGDIFPISVETRVTVLEDDMAELFWGCSIRPLCDRQIPSKGTE